MECNIDTQEISPSGTVGKQVFAAGTSPKKTKLMGFILSPGAASAVSVVIREGNASGEVKYELNTVKADPKQIHCFGQRFDRGMHVKVIGTGGYCILQLC